MYFDFAFFLTIIVIIAGIITLLDKLFWRKERPKNKKPNWIVEYSRSFFPVLLLVWAVRSFVVQPYRVPTGSLEPTVLPGDFIAVNQFAYGLKFPIGNFKLVSIGEPKRGDIVLFYAPLDPSTIYVKRLIGLPGDHVVYKNKTLYINGKKMEQKVIGKGYDDDSTSLAYMHPEILKQENLEGVKHNIYVWPQDGLTNNYDLVVPKGEYFMMGDNRDNSDDSRAWGFVPEHDLIGKAMIVWMSWDSVNYRVRWHRIGTIL